MKINPLERIQFSRRKILESKNFTSCIETNLKYDVKLIKKKSNPRSNRRIGASSNLFRVNNFRARSLVNGARKRALSPPQKWVATNRCGGVEHRVFSPRRISLKTRLVESSTRRENPREEPLPSSLSPSPPRGTKSGSLVNARGNAKRAKSCAPRGGGGGGGGNDTIRFCRRQSSCRLITTPLASPSRPSPPSSRSQTPGTNVTEWLSQAGTSVKSHLPWPLTSRQ